MLDVVVVSTVCVSHTGIAVGRKGWMRCGSGNRGSIVDNQIGDVLGVVVGAAGCVE